ncbi:hypothetical protein LNP00_00740 [Fructobacillus sp. M158]|uniref:mucin-binding protein n=1 Tax=Fructobacillus parabroussonetiae TaxID=2713174 RepID=UPI00200A85C8|nr:hypothetical protein [Fructobacillus parabroussonetiae]MCK8616897.1 hypothetical protein [Fructobacillus parabroussonetiae]
MTSTNTSAGFANKIRTLYYPLIQAEYRNDNRYYAYTNMFNIYTLMGNSYLPNDRFSDILSTLDQVNEQVNAVPVSKGIQDTDYWPTMARSFAKSAIQRLVAQAESFSSQNKDKIEEIANEYLAKLPSSDWLSSAQVYAQAKSDILNTISNKTVSRTIKYVDADNPDQEVAKSETQSVTITQKFKVYNYTVTPDGWDTGTFDAVTSPDLSAQGYQPADSATVASATVSGDSENQVVTVKYAHNHAVQTADNPGQVPVADLQKTVTRTVHYVDAQGKQLAAPTVQTVTLQRQATVDQVTNKVLSYSDWSVASGDWASVVYQHVNAGQQDGGQDTTTNGGGNNIPSNNGGDSGNNTPAKNSGNSGDNTPTDNDNDTRQASTGGADAPANASASVAKATKDNKTLPATAKEAMHHEGGLMASLALASAAAFGFFLKNRREDK